MSLDQQRERHLHAAREAAMLAAWAVEVSGSPHIALRHVATMWSHVYEYVRLGGSVNTALQGIDIMLRHEEMSDEQPH